MKRSKPRYGNGPDFTYALVLLFFISVYMLSGILARYVTADSVSDSAHVASFSVGHTSSSKTQLTVNVNEEYDTDDYDFSISNDSEVDVSFDITVEFPASPAISDWLKLSLVCKNSDNSETVLAEITGEENNHNRIFDFSKLDRIVPGEEKHYSLRFGYESLESTISYYNYSDILVSAVVVQID